MASYYYSRGNRRFFMETEVAGGQAFPTPVNQTATAGDGVCCDAAAVVNVEDAQAVIVRCRAKETTCTGAVTVYWLSPRSVLLASDFSGAQFSYGPYWEKEVATTVMAVNTVDTLTRFRLRYEKVYTNTGPDGSRISGGMMVVSVANAHTTIPSEVVVEVETVY